ncbi:porin [Acinetobacter guerrae]|uniref:Porin n=1 Tax=Acinetobacter guerrae TaxID=1843371 RepID=A0A3A8ECJ0_9GAMM|nr:porin [Acinetobacter guerrae]RKG32692.1 porin [Acinetobacter guerrae]
MKKLLIAAAVSTLSITAAQAAPTLYGKLNVTLDQVDNSDFAGNDVTALNSNASRIGVKGEEKLTDKVSVVYLAEWAISTDGSGSDTDLSARNRFIGLKFNKIGTLKAGKFDSYFKTSAGNNQDIFNDHTILDMTSVLHGEERLNNVIGFETDKDLIIPGLQFNIMAQQGEDTKTDNTIVGQEGKRDSFGDSISTSITYENKDYGVAAAIAGDFGVAGKYNAYSLSGIYSDAIRVTGSVDLTKAGVNGLVFGALWQNAQPTDDTVGTISGSGATAIITPFKGLEEDAWGLTAAYAIASTPWKIKGEYIESSTSVDNRSDRKISQYGLGVDYNFNKQARFYGVLAQQKRDWLSDDDKKTVVGVGMEYNF